MSSEEIQGSVFDVNPSDNKDYQKKLHKWIKQLELSKLLFTGKDENRIRSYIEGIDKLIVGIRETLDTGLGILDLPNDKQFKAHVNKLQIAADKLPTMEQTESLQLFLSNKAEEKEEYYRTNGNLINEFKTLEEIPGFERTKEINLCEKIGMDFTPAIQVANEVRELLLDNEVYDVAQRHKVMSKKIPTFPGATLNRLASDVSQQLKEDLRGDESWRISRIYNNAQEAGGVDIMMLHPDRIEETRKTAFGEEKGTLEKIEARKKVKDKNASSPSR